jgi:hypothetical protein
MMVGGVQISDVDEAVVALVDENGRVKRVSYCGRKDGTLFSCRGEPAPIFQKCR